MKTPEEFFKKWSKNCRTFKNYKPIHSHEDMMRFAKEYYEIKVKINVGDEIMSVGHVSKIEKIEYCPIAKVDLYWFFNEKGELKYNILPFISKI